MGFQHSLYRVHFNSCFQRSTPTLNCACCVPVLGPSLCPLQPIILHFRLPMCALHTRTLSKKPGGSSVCSSSMNRIGPYLSPPLVWNLSLFQLSSNCHSSICFPAYQICFLLSCPSNTIEYMPIKIHLLRDWHCGTAG